MNSSSPLNKSKEFLEPKIVAYKGTSKGSIIKIDMNLVKRR